MALVLAAFTAPMRGHLDKAHVALAYLLLVLAASTGGPPPGGFGGGRVVAPGPRGRGGRALRDAARAVSAA